MSVDCCYINGIPETVKDNMKGLYKFHWTFRNGDVECLFISNKKDVDNLLGEEIYFGEILGKHSDVYGTIIEGDIELLSEDQDNIDWLFKINNGEETITGDNPVHCWKDNHYDDIME